MSRTKECVLASMTPFFSRHKPLSVNNKLFVFFEI